MNELDSLNFLYLNKFRLSYNNYGFALLFFEQRFDDTDLYYEIHDGKIIRLFLDSNFYPNEFMFQFHNTTREIIYPFFDFYQYAGFSDKYVIFRNKIIL